jgi:predicted outer membrane protein
VKKFGAQTVNGHKKVLPEAEQLASRHSVPLPTNLTPEDKQKVDELSKLTGHVFDRANMNLALQNHEATLKEFRHHVNTLKYPDLGEYFTATLTDVTCSSILIGETRWSTIRSH